MGVYAISMQDGSVAIMQTVPRFVLDESGEVAMRDPTPEECLVKWHPNEQAKVVSHQLLDLSDIPEDRTFRNAWVIDGSTIVHDMEKAREIKRDQLRKERAPLLAALDIEYQRADENKDEVAKTKIAAKKQALRDITKDPAIDAATSPEELKAVKPAALANTIVGTDKGDIQ